MALLSSAVFTFLLFFSALFASSVYAIVSDTYVLDTEYSGPTFFDGFEFFTDTDPTHGFVSYQSYESSLSKSLISTSNNVARMSVDSTTVLKSDESLGMRASVRISSKKRYTHGLFLVDVKHMPGNECGVWPAFWMFGPNWPNSGEIDIIEGVNLQQGNVMTLHVGQNCTISGAQSLGTLQSNDCNQDHGFGCSVSSSSSTSYGDTFNSASGGVFATQWTSDYIRIWYFPRGFIPTNIANGQPDPSTWGLPDANFQGNCDIDANFKDHQIIFDTTFCGDWAAGVWDKDPVCSKKATTCADYVASEPGAFADAYWDVNYVKVFSLTEKSAPTSTSVLSRSTSESPSLTSSLSISTSEFASTIYLNSTTKSTPPLSSTSITDPEPEQTTDVTSTIESSSSQFSTLIPTSRPGPTFNGTSETLLSQSPTHRPSSPTAPFPPFPTSPQNTTIPKPPTLQDFTYVGCLSSSISPFPNFTLAATNENMTTTLCASECSNDAYLGTAGTSCFCGNSILNTKVEFDSSCTIPCPGNPTQVCGGFHSASAVDRRTEFEQHHHQHLEDPAELAKHQSFGFLLTVFQNDLIVIDLPGLSSSTTADSTEVHFAPSTGEIPTPSTTLSAVSTLIGVPMGVSDTDSVEPTMAPTGVHFGATLTGGTTDSVTVAGSLIGIGMGGGLGKPTSVPTVTTITIVLTTTYTDICKCAASTLQVYTTTSTLIYTDCGCKHPSTHEIEHTHIPEAKTAHQIPMTTITRICADCGSEGRVTLTVPCTEPTHAISPPIETKPPHQVYIPIASVTGAALFEHSAPNPAAPSPVVEIVTSIAQVIPVPVSVSVSVPAETPLQNGNNQTFVLSNTGEGLRWKKEAKWGVCVVLGLAGVGVGVV
ncbi:hypothetical protein ONS96_005966 [Cadophora gregata f. sp. sojae]|nr:hypothetical protein ONS96_005966 [Cadophora gregata f. sp. sojae]